MSDLISREAVLELFATHDGKYLYEAIRDMPAVETEDCDTCKHGYFGDRQCDNCRVRYPSHYEREEGQHEESD